MDLLIKIKNTNKEKRTELHRALLHKQLPDFHFNGKTYKAPKYTEKWLQLIVFGVEVKDNEDIIVIYSVGLKKVFFMWKPTATSVLHYTESLTVTMARNVDTHFTQLIHKAQIV